MTDHPSRRSLLADAATVGALAALPAREGADINVLVEAGGVPLAALPGVVDRMIARMKSA